TGDITSPYASYFILEYDRAAGNNAKVQFGQQSLPNGLRVFRVQAALDDEGGPVHTNNGTASGNRLIELVDPDGLDEHAVTTNGGYMKKGANQYGCMLFEGGKLGSTAPSDSSLQGASVEPTTPGTTLDGKGTGIGIEVKSISQDSSQSNQDSQCTVTISTQASSDPDPDPDPEPTPTPTPTTVTHKVIFKANGHGTSPTTQIVEHGKTATKPADPTADGYTFGGWYKDEACTQAYDFSTPVTADTALYAKWTQKSGAAAGAEEASKAATNKNQSSTKAASSTTSKNQTSSKAGTASSKTGDSPLVIGVVALVIVSGAAVVIAARRSRER
ncbi:MAG: InlB B-repeat-containing protein, partial [Eggerthellaceae bacterium]|nr:InlB B-repeat-containing protein [Eggerthellaceae bacterium]